MAEERKSQAETDFAGLQNLAERMGLDDDQKEGFLESVMGKLGHKRSTSWLDAEPESGKGKSGGNDRPWGY